MCAILDCPIFAESSPDFCRFLSSGANGDATLGASRHEISLGRKCTENDSENMLRIVECLAEKFPSGLSINPREHLK